MYPSNFIHNLQDKILYYSDGVNNASLKYEVNHKTFFNIQIDAKFSDELIGLRKIFIIYAINELLKFDGCTVELKREEHAYIKDYLEEAGVSQRQIKWI